MQATVQNELNGSTNLIVTPPFSTSDPGYSNFVDARSSLFDDAISPDADAEMVTCTGPTSLAGDVLSFSVIVSSGSLTARSFVFVLSHDVMSDSAWTSFDFSLRYQGSEVASDTGLQSSRVFYSKTPIIFDEIHIQMTAPVDGFQLCFDEIMAIRAHYLNPSAVSINLSYVTTEPGYTSDYPSYAAPFSLDPNPFSDSWDLNDCWTSQNIGDMFPAGWSRISI